MPNQLAHETSPYLLQHAGNPVDWRPWGDEALTLARELDRPIFLSIGYSACHWCHVMEHESFEDATIAGQLNEHFVCIKVDREERPDLDQIYMNAVMAMTGRGGWPMSVFLTPQLKPFYGGTYWPPQSRMGMAGFSQIIAAVHDAWQSRRAEIDEQAESMGDHLRQMANSGIKPAEQLPPQLLKQSAAALERVFDHRHGGFGGAPKFPHPMDLRVLLRQWRREPNERLLAMVTHTLDRMAAGGIYDQLGGGFHRYSVDERWLVPHFEKMLYDNALLVPAYLEAFQATGNPAYRQIAADTCDYVLREMTHAQGGFYSTQDADSEGVEGKFYVWTPQQIADVLGPQQAETFGKVYDVTADGNFEHANILNLLRMPLERCAAALGRELDGMTRELAESRAKLLAARNGRVWPALDDKVLVSWNGLMIDAMAQAGRTLDEPRYVAAAIHAAEFIEQNLQQPDGRLLHTWRQGQAKFNAYLDDYACLGNALVTLYEATFDARWIDWATTLANRVLRDFADDEQGAFFFTARDHEALIARTKDIQDSSVPSGNAMAATMFARLGKLTGRVDYSTAAERVLLATSDFMQRAPSAAGQMLIAADFFMGPTCEAVLAWNDEADGRALRQIVVRHFWPRCVLAGLGSSSDSNRVAQSDHLAALLADKPARDGQPTLYICEGFACQQPVVGLSAIAQRLDELCK